MRIETHFRFFLPAFLPLMLLAAATSTNDKSEEIALREIRGDRLAAHVHFLASDLLEGRATGTRGYNLAANYVANQFEELGLKPGGNDGGYFQKVPFRKADLIREKVSMNILQQGQTIPLKLEQDFLIAEDFLRTESSVEAPVIFAGFGVTAPEFNYDDFSGIDAKGKIAIVLSGSPDAFPLNEHAYYSSSAVKEANLAQHGVVGYIAINNPDDQKRRRWDRSVRQSKLPGYRWLEQNGTPSRALPQLKAHAYLSHDGAERLFAGAQIGLNDVFQMWKDQKLHGFSLPIQIKMQTATSHEKVDSPNIIGILPGSDPKLRNEYVVYSAHLDHLGVSDPVNGDRINNGAYDNATGASTIIELARAFSMLRERPHRSILFLAATGEEEGLQGSEYFARNPTIPASSIVADINTDMFLMLFPVADLVTIGAEHSSLGPIAAQATTQVGLKTSPDPFKQEVIFVRSDQYSFIKEGVPSVMFTTGITSSDPSINGMNSVTEWLRTIYHSPQDDFSQKMHWESGVKLVQAAFLTGLRVANAQSRPTWNSGDFFGKKFSH